MLDCKSSASGGPSFERRNFHQSHRSTSAVVSKLNLFFSLFKVKAGDTLKLIICSLDAGWQPITSVPAEEFRRVFDVNCFGVFLVTRTLLPLLQKSPNGLQTVIGITSMSSHVAAPSIAMGMSKLALNRFMEYLARAHGAEGLMSYALHPGGVKTRMSQDPGKVPGDLAASKFPPKTKIFLQNRQRLSNISLKYADSVSRYARDERRSSRVACEGETTLVEWPLRCLELGHGRAGSEKG